MVLLLSSVNMYVQRRWLTVSAIAIKLSVVCDLAAKKAARIMDNTHNIQKVDAAASKMIELLSGICVN